MNPGIWNKLTRAVIFLLILAGVMAVVVWYLPLIRQNEHMRQNILKLDAQVQQDEETGKKLRAAIDAIHRDPKTVERLARERLGYAKPDETVIHFEDPVATNAGASVPR